MKLVNIKKNIYTVVSLFAGAGGLDIGFENKGLHTIMWGTSTKERTIIKYENRG